MKSSIGQLRDFKSSAIWQDITSELEVWLGQIHEQLENIGVAMEPRELDRLGGCAEAIRNFHDIVDVLIGLAEDRLVERELLLKKLGKREIENGRGE